MFIKSLAATATAVIASFTIAPFAEAGINHKAIAEKLHSIGVTTSYGECGDSPHGSPIGTYNFIHNHFCLSNQIQEQALLDETVTHELVHVIQDCIGGGIGTNQMGSVTRYLSDGDTIKENSFDESLISILRKEGKLAHVHEWTSHMQEDTKWIEREAYALENSPLFVLKLLNQCGVN